jgi:hypothetical protein
VTHQVLETALRAVRKGGHFAGAARLAKTGVRVVRWYISNPKSQFG